MLLGFLSIAYGQPSSAIRIAGTVVSAETGHPLEGATITLKTGQTGVLTDEGGKFILSTNLPEGEISVSHIGYQSQTIRFGPENGGPFTIRLERDENSLQEVEINAGYYKVTDRERTGSIARVDAKTIAKQPVLNVLEALKGQMAGVDIQQQTAVPNAAISIRIRGENSLRSGGNEPLVVLDGVPMIANSLQQGAGSITIGGNPLSFLNSADIAEVVVLKDADATAIYGSLGSNGVLLITTRKAESSRQELQLDVKHGAGVLPGRMELLHTAQYLAMREEAFRNTNRTPDAATAPDLTVWDREKFTDWQEELLGGRAQFTNGQLSLSGSSGDTRYLISGNYQKNGNIYLSDKGYQRGGGHLNISQGNAGSRLQLGFSASYTVDNNHMPAVNWFQSAMTLPPNAPELYLSDGTLNWADNTFDNPMAAATRQYHSSSDNLNTSIAMTYRLSPAFSVKASVGYNRLAVQEETRSPVSSYKPRDRPFLVSSVSLYDNRADGWVIEPQADYRKQLGAGSLALLAGGSVQLRGQQGKALTASGFINELLMDNIQAAENIRAAGFNYSQYRYLAVFARASYALRERYIINLTARRDGSSRFGPGHQWGNFGAIGGAWIFSEEKWLGFASHVLSFGKLRASLGTSGSDRIDDYGYLPAYQIQSGNHIYQIPVLNPVRIGNRDYRWESNRKLETGIDLGLFRNRITATAAYYANRSSNQLVGLPLPVMTGFPSVQYNLPATVSNTGWEFEVTARPFTRGRFSWQSSVNVSLPRTVLTSFPDIGASAYSQTYQVGEPTAISLRYAYEGVDPATGLYRFADTDGSGTITSADRIWHRPPPVRTGGVNNVLSFAQVDVSFFLQYDSRLRSEVGAFSNPGDSFSNQPAAVMERWQSADQPGKVQKFWTGSGAGRTAYSQFANSTAAYRKVTFVRLSNVSVGWNCPASLLAKVGLKSARMFVTGQNLHVFGRYAGLDPETSLLHLPLLRTIIAGLQISL